MAELPAGTITMLFSDIEGSTALLDRLGGDRYGAALSAVRALLRAAFADHGGREMGTEGDSFFVVFASAADAVRCCVTAQQALAAHHWPDAAAVRVRMGLHSGEPVRHEDGYLGLDVHRASRIAAVAHGGQVVLSEASRLLVASRLPAGVSIKDLGFYRLKDIAVPERIYQLVMPGLPDRFPPLKAPMSETAAGGAAAGPAPIVGRVAERQALLAAYAHAAAGRAQLLLVTGAAGIGKTRLVQELCAQAASAAGGAQVLVGESAPLAGAALAYGPFAAALRGQAEWLLSDAGARNMLAARHRLFVRVLDLLTALAASSPVVLVLEDLHWADESSRELLAFLAVRLRDTPVMMIGTLREEELTGRVGQWLAELERRPGVTRLRLERLPDSEIAELVTDLVPTASAEQVAAVAAAAEGNPLYARELASADPQQLPTSITDAVLAQAAGLTAQARAVVDQVCVADGGMSHELLAATVSLPEKRLLASTRRAVASGLLVTAGDGYAFRHALIRQVLYAELLPGERRHLHRRLAEALAARTDSEPGLLAQHWHLAGCPDQAAPVAVVAAHHAVSARAYPEAVRHYALAIELAPWLPEPVPGLLEEAAQAASWAGDPDRAAEWAGQALSRSSSANPADRARLLERIGRYRFEAGDLHAAIEATGQAVALLSDGPPSALRARVLAALATWRMLLGEFGETLPIAVQAVAEARQADADAELAHGLATLGVLQAHQGAAEAGVAALRRSFALARRTSNVEDVIRAATNLMYLLYTAGRFTEALEVAQDGRQAARSLDAPSALTSALENNIAGLLLAAGRWEEADRLLTEALGESEAKLTRYLELLQLELAVGRGETQRAAKLAATLQKSPHDPGLIGPLRACLAEQALYAGDLATAADEVLDGLAALAGTDWSEEELRLLAAGTRVAADLTALPEAVQPPDLPDLWDSAAVTFDARARAITERDGAGRPAVAAFGALAAAEHARQQGIDDGATWGAVADAWRVAGQPYREAYAHLREAAAEAKAGRHESAARALAAGRALASELASAPLLRLASELERRGGPGE
ncbi:MAG: AAA family ATPase [Streptosporangiaceae bacterium]|nr:AAA family ATPase [Streptosporangiaceae bacterium]